MMSGGIFPDLPVILRPVRRVPLNKRWTSKIVFAILSGLRRDRKPKSQERRQGQIRARSGAEGTGFVRASNESSERLILQHNKAHRPNGSQNSRRKRRSPEEIMDRLLQAAEEEFKRNGFAGATTAAIARRADVTEAQLFRYFATKADLFREAIFKPLNQHFLEFNARHLADADKVQGFREMARLFITEQLQFLSNHSQMFMSLVVAEAYAPESTQGVGEIDSLRTYFERGAAMMSARVEKDPKVDPKLMVRVSFAAILACVIFKDWIFPKGMASRKEISAAITDFVIDGLSANTDQGLKKNA